MAYMLDVMDTAGQVPIVVLFHNLYMSGFLFFVSIAQVLYVDFFF